MDEHDDDWGTPTLEAVEDRLAVNYRQFEIIRVEWTREWQRAKVERHRARKESRAQRNSAATRDDDAA